MSTLHWLDFGLDLVRVIRKLGRCCKECLAESVIVVSAIHL